MAQSSSSQPQEDVRQVAMLSNLGLVQHSQGKPNTAALCFTQALHRSAQLASMVGLPVATNVVGCTSSTFPDAALSCVPSVEQCCSQHAVQSVFLPFAGLSALALTFSAGCKLTLYTDTQ